MKDLILIIEESLQESDSSYKENTITTNTEIFGGGSNLDSLGLINFLVSVEQKIEDTYGMEITIADEKAMSLKNSPFRTVDSLNDYLTKLIKANE